MSTVELPTFTSATVADLLTRLDGIPPERVRLGPAPGTATERDVLERNRRKQGLCELVDGVLVEKPMGFYEAFLAAELIRVLGAFVAEQDLGLVTGPDGAIRLAPGLVRIPDVAFFSWKRLPGQEFPTAPIPELAPDLAIEILSESNTSGEMQRKLREYFAARVKLVWLIDPASRTARAYTSAKRSTLINAAGDLEGGRTLPGFKLSLGKLFARASKRQSKSG